MWIYAIQILMIALGVAFLLSWGMVKKHRQSEELLSKLMRKCEQKIIGAFKKEACICKSELIEMVDGIQAKVFWSRKRAVIQEPEKMIMPIIQRMLELGWIIEGKQKTYHRVDAMFLHKKHINM